MKDRHQRFRIVLVLVLGITSIGSAWAGPITRYQMDNVLALPAFGTSFTFVVNDLNGDGIGSSDEIIDFAGFECFICPAPITTLGRVENDVLFGGSGEAFLDLTTLNWTYEITGATRNPGMPGVVLPPQDLFFGADFGVANAAGFGSPIRLFAVQLPGQPRIWSVAQVPEPGTMNLMLLGIAASGLMRKARTTRDR